MHPAKFLYIILDTTSRKNQFYVSEKEITKGLWNKFSTFDTWFYHDSGGVEDYKMVV